MTGQFDTYGKHCIVDFWGCDSQTIDNLSFMEALCVLAANAAGATVVDILYKKLDGILSDSKLQKQTRQKYVEAINMLKIPQAKPSEIAASVIKKFL